MHAVIIGDAKQNPLTAQASAAHGKSLVGGAFIVHHVNALFVPAHAVIILHVQDIAVSVLIGHRDLVIHPHLPHNAVQLLHGDLRLAKHLHIQAVPGQMVKAGPDRHMAQRAVVLLIVCLEVGGQIPGLVVIQGFARKILRQLKHVRRVPVVRPHDAGIIPDILLPCAHKKRQEIGLVFSQQILNGQRDRHAVLPIVPGLQLGLFHKAVHGKAADLVADPGNGVPVGADAKLQGTVLRQHRDGLTGRLILHILQIAVHSVDLFPVHFRINHGKRGFIHCCVYSILFFHGILSGNKIDDSRYEKYNCQDADFFQRSFHSLCTVLFYV